MSIKDQVRRAAEEQRQTRATVKREAIYFIKGIYGVTEKQASAIFDEISSGSVPHIKVIF